MATSETRLFLVRHGESVAQEQGFLSGHDTCKGLSATGRAQVESLRDRLVATGELGAVDAVYTSILPRAIESARDHRPRARAGSRRSRSAIGARSTPARRRA